MRASKMIVAAVLVILVLAIGGGVVWYVSVPHTPEAQFAYAEKLEKKLQGDALTQSPKELEGEVQQVEEQYRRVGTRFGANPKAAEGLKRIAKIDELVGKDREKTIADLEELIKDYPDEDGAGFGLLEEARLIRAEGDDLKTGKPEDAAGKYKDAIAKLEQYRKTFAAGGGGKGGDQALREIGGIGGGGLGDR